MLAGVAEGVQVRVYIDRILKLRRAGWRLHKTGSFFVKRLPDGSVARLDIGIPQRENRDDSDDSKAAA